MRGRKPKPTVLRILQGNPGRRPLNADEPQPEPLALKAPIELKGDARARKEWKRTIAPAILTGQITAADRALAIGHCLYWSIWLDQLAIAREQKHVLEMGKHGYATANPIRAMADRTYTLLEKTDNTLGLSPTARARVRVDPHRRKQTAVEAFKAKKGA